MKEGPHVDMTDSEMPAPPEPARPTRTPPSTPEPPSSKAVSTARAGRADLEWYEAVEKIRPYVVKIATPHGSGTGFLFAHAGHPDICGIATAAHVVREAHVWEEPILIEHVASGKSIMVRHGERGVQLDLELDTASVVIIKSEIPFPSQDLPLTPTGRYVRVGNELGWVGFPDLAQASGNLCFFSGRVSAWIPKQRTYLVDGVAIHGVSGGPAILPVGHEIHVVGVVTSYHPHRLPGETWPGLCGVRDVKLFQDLVKSFRSLEEALKKQTPPSEVQVPHEEGTKPEGRTGEDAPPTPQEAGESETHDRG